MPCDLPLGVRRERIEPLWDRVERNRVKFVAFIVAYLASIALSVAAVVGLGSALLGLLLVRAPQVAYAYYVHVWQLMGATSALAIVLGAVWVGVALGRSEKHTLGRLGAVLTRTGTYIPSKQALKDMALAAGFAHAPPLWIIPGCDRVNAFAVGRNRKRAIIGITEGFADRLTPDDQRAVFANLMARVCNEDVRWATAVSVLVGPLWAQRERDLRRGDNDKLFSPGEDAAKPETGASAFGHGGDASAVVLAFILYGFVIVVSELLLAGHQRSAMLTAEKADAEGMMLLKDPREMLRALDVVLEANNTVPTAGETYSALFYCWAGFGFASEDDPEFRRLARLREVLGAEGMTIQPQYTIPANARDMLAPVAPRVEPSGEDPN